MSRELFGLDLLEGAPHGQTSSLDVASRKKLIDNLQRHHRIRPLGTIGDRLLRLVSVVLWLAQEVSRTAFKSRGQPHNGFLWWVLRASRNEVLNEPGTQAGIN